MESVVTDPNTHTNPHTHTLCNDMKGLIRPWSFSCMPAQSLPSLPVAHTCIYSTHLSANLFWPSGNNSKLNQWQLTSYSRGLLQPLTAGHRFCSFRLQRWTEWYTDRGRESAIMKRKRGEWGEVERPTPSPLASLHPRKPVGAVVPSRNTNTEAWASSPLIFLFCWNPT